MLGPILGSFILSPLAELTRWYFSSGGWAGAHLIVYGVLLVAVVCSCPGARTRCSVAGSTGQKAPVSLLELRDLQGLRWAPGGAGPVVPLEAGELLA